MLVLFFVLAFFGLSIGSFLNVLIYRLPRNIPFVFKRSFCPKCRKKISWFDNVPLFSFFILKGLCRQCHSPISWRYPLVELLAAGFFVLVFSQIGQISTIGLILSLILFSGLIVIFFIDLEHQIIPDKIVLPLCLIYFIYYLVTDYWLLVTNHLPSAVVSFLLFLSLFLITKGKGMGFGDVKLSFLMGLVLGFPKVVIAFYIAFLTGAFLGIILILVKKAKFGKPIAFGPFLVFGTTLSYLWGEKIIKTLEKLLF
ncbi:prepilin peptidase [Candidatus Microgenomates bacterium]|jgi:prepilin signal peptidase PulO-like enzyme (type II secretory pathway)|nr:MAG: prepilin peptidase [Candidatus Microgenomates bacterium]